MFWVVVISILIVMILAFVRAVMGPTVYDRLLAVNVFGTKTVLLVSVMAVLAGRADFVDLAIVYILINFITMIAVLHFFEHQKLISKEEDEW